MSELPEKIPLFIFNSNESTSLFITHYTNHKDSSGITSYTSNDFSTAANSASLVGELKTPSLPPSVHIPSIIPSWSLLPSRDEVFKEIKNVGEDVAISSLHLFQVDMDLPSLSFHASLVEQWDEEEEPEDIETVLKVVSPSSHQYLDVFSKVKAEKRPPHRTCDHHIELEGLLPAVGVIYYLSKNESETLWAYISENLGKGFIRPSSSSTGAPVLFVKKKDGGFCLCVDYRKLNAVTRKNRYPVSPINQLLTVFNVFTIFSKIDLHGAYNLLRIKEGDEHLTAFRTKFSLNFTSLLLTAQVDCPFTPALSHQEGMYPERGVDFISKNPQSFHQVLKQNEIKEVGFFSHLVDHIQKTVWQDPDYKEILKQLARGDSVSDYTHEPQVKFLLFKHTVVITSNHELQLDILQKHHDSLLAGHPGQERTLNLIKRDFYWAGMNQIIKDYVS
ncbi:hypothetical protein O181_035911 [Austropuccinia psidii MF-1]|uniref:Integrase zinc-binding domain-containing protein n=1 Tax=Austropuccinia psidii MF-1 TaxID=1389203 RepID=A0A9Q3H9E7_9BASI|nr:hypothetical protein [Austropuccinia psidii MF-1]